MEIHLGLLQTCWHSLKWDEAETYRKVHGRNHPLLDIVAAQWAPDKRLDATRLRKGERPRTLKGANGVRFTLWIPGSYYCQEDDVSACNFQPKLLLLSHQGHHRRRTLLQHQSHLDHHFQFLPSPQRPRQKSNRHVSNGPIFLQTFLPLVQRCEKYLLQRSHHQN